MVRHYIKYILILSCAVITVAFSAVAGDAVPTGFSRPLQWRVGADIAPAWVPGTNIFLRGLNDDDRRIDASMSGNIRADFSFSPATRQGILYKGLYQGVGVGVNTFFANHLLGTPVSAYVYQGAPIVHLGSRMWLGYEWQFGAAFGWKHYDSQTAEFNVVAATSVTAHMAIGFKLHYAITDRWQVSLGIGANHFSNGNTSWPNSGANSVGATVGVAFIIKPQNDNATTDSILESEADRHSWAYDITIYGAWRKRAVILGDDAQIQICPGRFGVLGLQFSPLYRLNRWVAVGPSADIQWDESACLAPYWVEGTWDDAIKFERPPFGRQLSVGLSAHAELTMPIFAVNAGLGYEILNPRGEMRFYQSLALKTFVTRSLYLNIGYRLGGFKDPQNLMVGLGLRL